MPEILPIPRFVSPSKNQQQQQQQQQSQLQSPRSGSPSKQSQLHSRFRPLGSSRYTTADGRDSGHDGHDEDRDDAAHTAKNEEVTSSTMRRTKTTQGTQLQQQKRASVDDAVGPLDMADTERGAGGGSRPQLLAKKSHTYNSASVQKPPQLDGGVDSSSGGGAAAEGKLTAGGEDNETASPRDTKEKKKGVSFLSRFIGVGSNNKKNKSGPSDLSENEHESSEPSDSRPEGMDAKLFSQAVDNIEFNPRHPQPPPYIKVRSKYKKEKEFDRVFLAQELRSGNVGAGTAGLNSPLKKASSITYPSSGGTPSVVDEEDTIWALEFSKDGKYLATGGQGKVVRVWAVISTLEERRQHEKEQLQNVPGNQPIRMSAAVFQSTVYRQYEGHEGAVIALSWSKNNFLLSASGDKTVRLWHVSRNECLCTFKHTEHVLSVQFHPRDDRFFLAGSRDMKLRLWSIPDKGVAFWKQCPEIITAVAFTPDGKTAIAGTVNGICLFYETEGLKYQNQMHVRSAHGKNAKGSKISSIQTLNVPPHTERSEVKLLIASNDSRIRLYNLRDKALEIKFKGHKSEERSIHATFSEDARYVISGSEDKGAYIYSTCPPESDSKPNQRPLEFFEASTNKNTWSVLAPTKTRQLLSQSEDPIYVMCNPPPVTLLSRSESVASSRPPTESGSVKAALPTDSPHRHPQQAKESPAYLARTAHPDGQIIITASNTGIMRVYRQDCAFTKRKSSEDSASVFSKKASSIYMARAMSRNSIGGGGRASRADSTGTQPPQDRILSWRQAISSTQSLDRTANANGHGSIGRLPSDAKSTRSISPRKSGVNGGRRQDSIAEGKKSGDTSNSFPLPRITSKGEFEDKQPRTGQLGANHPTSPTEANTNANSNTNTNPLWLQGTQSYMSWNPKEYATQAINNNNNNSSSLAPPQPLTRGISKVSVLSSEEEQAVSALAEGSDSDEETVATEAEVKCKRCGSGGFKARVVKGVHRLVCQKCGLVGAVV
ncbi:WD40 repeat-like protein [Tothia fuscella]|uniref:WD40 repeat-like protein n=1 Tax=Tothia fuscella TaxID=1048955 RepID=A0A9P4NXA4_9PEZI|nr:WD40 repeat-like protein [Tothia fuscella]